MTNFLLQETIVKYNMNNIVSLLFGKRSDGRRLISTSESILSESEMDEEESAFDSLAQRQDTLDVGDVYFPDTRDGEIVRRPWEEDTDDTTSLLSTTPVSKPFNLRDFGGLLAEKSVLINGFEAPSVVVGESFVRQDDDLSNCSRSWNILLRSRRSSSRKVKRRGKTWRPVVVKLEGASLKFHSAGESFPPFQVVSLLWSHEFRAPKYQDQHRLLITTLFNNLCGSSPKRIFKKRLGGKTNGLKVAKIGCTNRKVLHDLIGTVQRCIFGFPGFRQRGIQYRKDRMFVDVKGVYEGVQNRRDYEIKASNHVHVKVKAMVSGSPKCCMALNKHSSFDGQQETEAPEVSFHKCVQERSLRSPVAVTFVPLDNCWFELIHFKSFKHKPAPLRCEVSLVVHDSNRFELRAKIFATTSTTRADAAAVSHASNVTLQFHVPLSTAKRDLSGNGVKNTSVSKGKVHHNYTNETILWSIHKLPLKIRCPAAASEKHLASLNCHFCPTIILNPDEFTKEPVHMDFKMRGNNVMNIEEITLGSRKFENVKTNYSSLFRVSIPVHVSRI